LYQRLSIPHIYRHIVIVRPKTIPLLADRLVASPSLASHIRFLSTGCWGTVGDNYNILSRTTGLIRVRGLLFPPPMHWCDFKILAETSGSTLLSFDNFEVVSPSPESPSVFNSFVNLRSLFWHSSIVFKLVHDQISPTALPALETIHFKNHQRTFVDFLCHLQYVYILHFEIRPYFCFRLPSLSHVEVESYTAEIYTLFLEHGTKIRKLDFRDCTNLPPRILDVCSNVTLLTLGHTPTLHISYSIEPSFLHCQEENHSLEKINLNISIT
jgi:hypothetical protein